MFKNTQSLLIGRFAYFCFVLAFAFPFGFRFPCAGYACEDMLFEFTRSRNLIRYLYQMGTTERLFTSRSCCKVSVLNADLAELPTFTGIVTVCNTQICLAQKWSPEHISLPH